MSDPTPQFSLQVHPANQDIARVKGLNIKQLPEHEGGSWYMSLADAERFIRAQHMGELVEAAKELHHVAHKCLAVFVPSADGASEELSDAMCKVRAILDQLAKIGGGASIEAHLAKGES